MSVREIPVAIRAHTEIRKNKNKGSWTKNDEDLRKPFGKRILVLDTETTTDICMNLLFGQAMILEGTSQAHIDGTIKEHYLFYGDNLDKDQMAILSQYAKDKGIVLISRQDFIDKVFWPEVWELGSVCIGFNLPFDLSRLAISARTFQKGKHRDMFELKLSESPYKPKIQIKAIDSKKAFISLRFPTQPKTSSKRIPFRQGRFLDLRTLVFALTNESHSLDSACKLYQVRHGKGQAEEHGIINRQYIEYNRQDVEATLELYCKVKEEFDKHPLSLEAGKAYSPATIGKAYYKAMGIRPFHEKQPDFPQEIIGYAMAAYYGGRSECHYRNKPVKVFHTDITSMYPSVFTLQNLWSWVIAEKLSIQECTEEIEELLNNIDLEMLFNKEIWLSVPGLVQIVPDDDLLPVRAEYGNPNGYQIGLNHLTNATPMWYTLADIIACKIVTGKIPKIIRAIRIIPGNPQDDLNPVELRGQISIDPAKDNFFKKVIELRKEVKKDVKQKGDEADAMQLFLKILANSTSYGVYIEMNREEFEQEQEIDIFGLDSFTCTGKYVDINGNYYNPLIAVMITGAARLILGMMERTILDLGGNFAFCDTDSMSIIDLNNDHPEIIGRQVVARFKSLYPYDDESKDQGASLLEAEDYNWERKDWEKDTDKSNIQNDQYFPLYCFMVSAKRYVLYNLITDSSENHQIVIRKKSDHGLGHLTSPVKRKEKNNWVNDVWKSILSNEYNLPFQEPDWFYHPAFAQLSISKPSIYNVLNRDCGNNDYLHQVKPFNFMLVVYPLEDQLFRNDYINKYYCRLHRAIGLNSCNNKSKCKYASACFANLHMIPITPYDSPENWQNFNWLEKNTKEPLTIELSRNRSEAAKTAYNNQQLDLFLPGLSDSDKQAALVLLNNSNSENEPHAIRENVLTVKSYYDFIKEYAFHPELKYDDSFGNECGKNSKGLLQRTHIKTSAIKHIGKETNTLQDKEEEAIIPDEANWNDTILSYEKALKPVKSKIDYEQWQELISILQEKAKPRKIWVERFNISLDYFKQLLAGKRQPSPQLFELILKQCQKAGLQIPNRRKPEPTSFEVGKSSVYPIAELCLKFNISIEETKAIFKDSIFVLNRIEYLSLDSEHVKIYLSDWKQKQRKERNQKEMQALKNLKVYGKCLTGHNHEIESFEIDQISHFQISHEVGRSYLRLNVRLKNSSIYQVLQKDNPLIFKYGLLPKPTQILFDIGKRIRKKKNGYVVEYGEWQPYDQIPWLNEKQILNLYGISLNRLLQAVSDKKIPVDTIALLDGEVTINPFIVYRWFLMSLRE